MALVVLADGVQARTKGRKQVRKKSLPKEEEEDSKEDGQDADGNGLGLLEDLDDAVEKGSDPEKPLEEGGQHEGTNDGDVDNLGWSVGGQ